MKAKRHLSILNRPTIQRFKNDVNLHFLCCISFAYFLCNFQGKSFYLESPTQVSILVCEDGILAEEYTLQGADYYDYTDTEPTESGSELLCDGHSSWINWEDCVGKPCDEGRRIPLNNQGEKSACWEELACEDDTWNKVTVCDSPDDYLDTGSQTESGSEIDCESGEVSWGGSAEMWEICVGKPCEEGRRVPLNRDENQTEKSSVWLELVCQDGTWNMEEYYDSGWPSPSHSGSGSESGSEVDCTSGYGVWLWEMESCAGKPCEEEGRSVPLNRDENGMQKGEAWLELVCQDGTWNMVWFEDGSGGYTDYTDNTGSPSAIDGLEDYSTDEICYELCARKTLGGNKVDGLPDGFPDLGDLLPADPGAALQACLESCLGPLVFSDADGGNAGGDETDSTDEIENTVETTTTQWPFASGTFTTTEEFVTTLTPIATTTSEFVSTTVAPSACDEERTHECPNNSFCVPAENFVTFTCQCEAGYFMSGNMCHKKAPEAETCPEDFKKDLFKMKLDGLTNPKYYLNKGSVMIQVESQVISRFRIGLTSLSFVIILSFHNIF